MRISGGRMWALLRALDDPEHLEFPENFDHDATREKFERLVTALGAAFGCAVDADRGVQDASLHAIVGVPAEATSTGERLVLRISNFGSLATLSIGNPGSLDTEEMETLLDAEDADSVYRVLDDLGYVVVPEAPLWVPYDGPSQISLPGEARGTWWVRFFDYL